MNVKTCPRCPHPAHRGGCRAPGCECGWPQRAAAPSPVDRGRPSPAEQWEARAAALTREAETFRVMAAADERSGRTDMAARCRRSAADRDTEARVLRECVLELADPAPWPLKECDTCGKASDPDADGWRGDPDTAWQCPACSLEDDRLHGRRIIR